jgi:NAD dependent epimerase/dehydratase
MSSWPSRRVLVTGAAGFIGSHLTERLVSLGARVRVVVRYTSTNSLGWLEQSSCRSDLEVFSADINDGDVLARAMRGVDVVFHLAALIGIPYSYDAPSSYVRTNIDGTSAVLQSARNTGVTRVVHTSTSEVYGTAVRVPMAEDHPLQAQSPYAASKASADLFALAYHRSFGMPVTIVRPFNTYGPRQSLRAVIPTIVAQALAGDEIRLGDVTPSRDFVYVADTVDGFLRAGEAERAVGNVYNLGSGQEISVRDLVARIQALAGTTARLVHDAARERPEKSEVDRLCADATRARSDLGWQPAVSLDAGLRQTIDWMRTHVPRDPHAYRV